LDIDMSFKRDNKREVRRFKRELKRAGNKRVRKNVREQLRDSPDEVHLIKDDVGNYKGCDTKHLNGFDEKG